MWERRPLTCRGHVHGGFPLRAPLRASGVLYILVFIEPLFSIKRLSSFVDVHYCEMSYKLKKMLTKSENIVHSEKREKICTYILSLTSL